MSNPLHKPFSKIIVVDDDAQALESTAKILRFEGFEVEAFSSAIEALKVLTESQQKPDLILSDVRMPEMTGLEFLKALQVRHPEIPVVLMTAFGKIEDAVWAMKKGAIDFLSKPFKRNKLLESVSIALKRQGSRRGDVTTQSRASFLSDVWIGQSTAIRELRVQSEQVAVTHANILITGESGTGKELVARLIHQKGARASKPFIAINCAAFPESLLEAELFGHEKGAFTGADAARAGLFEAAHGGTLFLDEIGEMPLAAQAKLLRVLQEQEVRRVGSNQSIKVDVRVIAATHRNLKARVEAQAFREDLLYRLEVIHLHVAPLRERAEDIELLARHYLNIFSARHQKQNFELSPAFIIALNQYSWPGNIRELMNVLERAVIFSQGTVLQVEHLPAHIHGPEASKIAQHLDTIEIKIGTPLRDIEDLMIRKTLEATQGDKNVTAQLLGINSRTIYRKLGEGKTS